MAYATLPTLFKMKILYLDADQLNRTVGKITLDLEGHTTDLFDSKDQLTPGIENNYDALILDTDAFWVPGDRTRTTIGDYLETLSKYKGKIHIVTTLAQKGLERNLGDLIRRVSAHYKPFDLTEITKDLE